MREEPIFGEFLGSFFHFWLETRFGGDDRGMLIRFLFFRR